MASAGKEVGHETRAWVADIIYIPTWAGFLFSEEQIITMLKKAEGVARSLIENLLAKRC
jgi:hypothetical protein